MHAFNLVLRSSQPSERTSDKIHFDGVIMCQECDLLRAHAFLHAFRNAGSGEALAGFRRAMADRETFEAALRCTLCKHGMAELFLKSKQRAALEALVRDKKGLLAILPTGYGKLLVYQLSFSRCIQCHPWESEFGEFVCSSCFTVRITHTQQFLHSDWLRTCQFIQTERETECKMMKLSSYL